MAVYRYDDGSTLTTDDDTGDVVSFTEATDTGGFTIAGTVAGLARDFGRGVLSLFGGAGGAGGAGSNTMNPLLLLGLTGALAAAGQGSRSAPQAGYQGTVPKLTAVRERVAIPEDPNRRPGAGGRRYFSDTSYVAPGATSADTQAAVNAARTAARAQATTLKPALYPVPEVKTPEPAPTPAPTPAPSYASGVAALEPVPKYDEKGNVIAARGGLMGLAKGRYLSGPTDGMEDKVPATIAGKQPARLSHGEFVIPADVVGHLGNGNSEAGAKRLYDMMDRVRKARTGTPKQGKQINPNQYLPK